jgi:hypothetical protein
VTTPYEEAAAEVAGRDDTRTVELFGETFVLRGALSSLDLSELARSADIDSATEEGMAILAETFASIFDADDPAGLAEYRRFRKVIRRQAKPDDAVIEALGEMVEVMVGFPTEERPPSPLGQSPSTGTSKDDGSQQGVLAFAQPPRVANIGQRVS